MEAIKDMSNTMAGHVTSATTTVYSTTTSTVTAMAVLQPETKTKAMLLGPFQIMKVGRIIKNMQASDMDFSEEEIDIVVKAIYVTQSDEDLQKAFDMFDLKENGESKGFIKGDDFKTVLPLCGEEMDPDQIDDLFDKVDEDKSGNLEFPEFKHLMLAVNPTDGKSSIPGFDMFKERAGMIPGAGHVGAAYDKIGSGLGAGFSTVSGHAQALPGANHVGTGLDTMTDLAGKGIFGAMSITGKVVSGVGSGLASAADVAAANAAVAATLKPSTTSGLAGANPLQMTKIGRIIKSMKASETTFTNDDIDMIIKALYVKKTPELYKQAFDLFDLKFSGTTPPSLLGKLSADEFKIVLPLLGENIDPEKLDSLFKEVDADGSGSIELSEFTT